MAWYQDQEEPDVGLSRASTNQKGFDQSLQFQMDDEEHESHQIDRDSQSQDHAIQKRFGELDSKGNSLPRFGSLQHDH